MGGQAASRGGYGYTMLAGGAGVFRDPMADVVIAHIKNGAVTGSGPARVLEFGLKLLF